MKDESGSQCFTVINLFEVKFEKRLQLSCTMCNVFMIVNCFNTANTVTVKTYFFKHTLINITLDTSTLYE